VGTAGSWNIAVTLVAMTPETVIQIIDGMAVLHRPPAPPRLCQSALAGSPRSLVELGHDPTP